MRRDDPTPPTGDLPALSVRPLARPPRPGLVVALESGRPACRAIPFDGRALTLGRSRSCDVVLDDVAVSAKHASVALDASGRLVVEDLGSRHGTKVDALSCTTRRAYDDAILVRVGSSLLLVSDDVGPFERRGVTVENEYVIGPVHAESLDVVRLAAGGGMSLLVTGESGTGKERAAALYHESGPYPRGPFIPLSGPNLTRDLAESELFGAKRGAYSGAVQDRKGAIARAHHGTLFLDEVGDLAPSVQPKLLRVLETKSVMPLGGEVAQAIDVRIVAATHRDLEAMIVADAFRQDLYVRLAQARVALAPLRLRREEIPWLVELAARRASDDLARGAIACSVSAYEECCLRDWTGENVRGLFAAVKGAVLEAVRRGEEAIARGHFGERRKAAEEAPAGQETKRAAVEAAVRKYGGDKRMAAKELGVSVSTVYRWLGR